MWLVAHDRCWTADWLARRGLPHPAQCPLCDQEEETVNHLLVSCVFARQFWFYLLQHFGIQQFCPQPPDLSFDVWWENSSNATVGLTRKGFNSLVILGAWTLWNHRNRCVFDGATPSLGGVLGFCSRRESALGCGGGSGAIFLGFPASPSPCSPIV